MATGSGGATAASLAGAVNIAGNLSVTGTITSNGAKPFTIDHPLDPANKVLRHASIESPEVLNVYSGNVRTNRRGYATVRLPAYFTALNDEAGMRYTLTPIGAFTDAIIARKARGGRFVIRTRRPSTEVSWTVLAEREDRTMRAHPFRAEQRKAPADRGSYIEPALYDAPLSSTIGGVPGR